MPIDGRFFLVLLVVTDEMIQHEALKYCTRSGIPYTDGSQCLSHRIFGVFAQIIVQASFEKQREGKAASLAFHCLS